MPCVNSHEPALEYHAGVTTFGLMDPLKRGPFSPCSLFKGSGGCRPTKSRKLWIVAWLPLAIFMVMVKATVKLTFSLTKEPLLMGLWIQMLTGPDGPTLRTRFTTLGDGWDRNFGRDPCGKQIDK
eukprot:3350019-Amphidinium_carterae.1